MSAGVTTTCPYCNAFVPLQADAHDGQRVPCPRCGEIFPLRGTTGIQAPPGVATTVSAPPAVVTGPRARVPWLKAPRNRIVGLSILGVMLTMAGLGLAFALSTKSDRRHNDTAGPLRRKRPLFPEPSDTATTATSPTQLVGLRHLPRETNLLLGVHLAELRKSQAGRDLLSKPIKAGKHDLVLADLFRWTGLEVEEIDHLVVGVRTDADLPRVVVVARTLQPVDTARVRKTLDAKEGAAPRAGMTTYSFRVPRSALQPDLWFADDRTLVFDLLGGLKEVPEKPHDDLNFLTYEVRDALKDRVDPGALLWFAGGIADWDATAKQAWFVAATRFAGVDQDVIDRVKQLRVLAISVEVEPSGKAQAAIRGRDAAAAKAMRIALLGPEDGKLPDGVTTAIKDDWLTVQWKGDLQAALRGLVK
jgi:hypothetical protein